MPIQFVLTLVLTLAASFPTYPRAQRMHIGEWTLLTWKDPFRGGAACSLSARGVGYTGKAFSFRFSPSTDTSDAVYRVDGGAPSWARLDRPELAKQGLRIETDSLTNPSGGYVWIPANRLRGARSVSVQAGPYSKPVTFNLAVFSSALEQAHHAGCADNGFMVTQRKR